jgi:hypothetical protein
MATHTNQITPMACRIFSLPLSLRFQEAVSLRLTSSRGAHFNPLTKHQSVRLVETTVMISADEASP